MRFLFGVVVGIVIGRPILSVTNEHLTPPVRRKITDTLTSVVQRLNDRIEQEGDR